MMVPPKYMTDDMMTISDLFKIEDDINPLSIIYLMGYNNHSVRADTIYRATIHFLKVPWGTDDISNDTICIGSERMNITEGMNYHSFTPEYWSKSGLTYDELLRYLYDNHETYSPNAKIIYSTNSQSIKPVNTYMTFDNIITFLNSEKN